MSPSSCKTTTLAVLGLLFYLCPVALCISRPLLLEITTCKSQQCSETINSLFSLIVVVLSIIATSMAIWMGAFEDGFIDALGLASCATATAYVILHGFPTIPILIAIIVASCALVIPLRIVLKAPVPADPLFGFLTRLRISQIVHMLGILIIGAGHRADTLLRTVGGLFMQCGEEGVDGEDEGAVSTDSSVDSGGDEGPVVIRASGESKFNKWSFFNAVPPPYLYSPLPQSATGRIKSSNLLPL